MTLIIGAISSLSSFSNKGLSLSGPAAFPGFRFFRSFKRPLRDISMSGMTGMELKFEMHGYLQVIKMQRILTNINKHKQVSV